MCHRQLFFAKSTACGHLIFSGDREHYVDCQSTACYNSSAHPANCGADGNPCRCQRWYSQPERIVTHETTAKCQACIDAEPRPRR